MLLACLGVVGCGEPDCGELLYDAETERCVCPEGEELVDEGCVPVEDAGVDAAPSDAGADVLMDALIDAVVDASVDVFDASRPDADACFPTVCFEDEDEDGYPTPDSEGVPEICGCPEGLTHREEPDDCGPTTPEAFPTQEEYFDRPFAGRGPTGIWSNNLWDYNCDGVVEGHPLVDGGCRLGLAGTCEPGEGPLFYIYVSGMPPCGMDVEWVTCTETCGVTSTEMRPLPCH